MRRAPDAVHVWNLSVRQAQPRLGSLWQVLSEDERARATTYAFAVDYLRFVVARGTLRCLLGAYLGAAPAALRFCVGPRGKPALDGGGPAPLHFNVAHSGDVVLIAMARSGPVGVDVERIRDDVEVDAIAARYFAPAERRALTGLPPAAQRHAFFATWVRKEAYVKARGDGLARALQTFTVSVDPAAVVVDLADEELGVAGDWAIRSVAAGADYAAAVAVKARELSPGGIICDTSTDTSCPFRRRTCEPIVRWPGGRARPGASTAPSSTSSASVTT